jgi:hypothetical protein
MLPAEAAAPEPLRPRPAEVLSLLQSSGEFDELRSSLFRHESLGSKFECMQSQILQELSISPLLDVQLSQRARQVPKVFQAFRHAVRGTSVRYTAQMQA